MSNIAHSVAQRLLNHSKSAGEEHTLVLGRYGAAMVVLDLANSRMKDFYDLCVLFRSFRLETDVLAKALERTFERRGASLPKTLPTALTAFFSGDQGKRRQWEAFVRNNRLHMPMGDLSGVVAELREHLRPALGILGTSVK